MKFLYRSLLPLLRSFLWLGSVIGIMYQKVRPEHFRQRFGFFPRKSIQSAEHWFHLSSIGEIQNAKKLILQFMGGESTGALITVFNPDALELAKKVFPGFEVLLLPFESGKNYAKIIQNYSLKNLWVLETEIWPELFFTAHRLDLAVYLVNAYIYPKEFQSYKRWRGFFSSALSQVSACYCQSEADKERYHVLGIEKNKIKVCGDLRYDISAQSVSPGDELLKVLESHSGSKKRHIFASVHPAEYSMIAEAIVQAKGKGAFVIAPRLLASVAVLQKALEREGLSYEMRSDYKNKGEEAVLILDSFGELRSVYNFCETAFIGGSLIQKHGGQNPLEALAASCAVASGASMYHFQSILRDFEDYLWVLPSKHFAEEYALWLDKAEKTPGAAERLKKLSGASDDYIRAMKKGLEERAKQ